MLESMIQAGQIVKPKLDKLFPENIVNITMNFFRGLGNAPVLLLVYMPENTYDLSKDMRLSDKFKIEYDRFTNTLSAAALIQNILLLAKEKGLGTCWLTAPKHAEEGINEEMGIKDMELVSVVTIGYPDQDPPAPKRKGEKIQWIGY